MRKVAMTSIWICYLACANHMFHILIKVGRIPSNDYPYEYVNKYCHR